MDDEPTGSVSSLIRTTVFTPFYGELEVNTDRDMIGVYLTAGTEYTVMVQGVEYDLDTVITGVYRSNCSLLSGTYDDDGGPGYGSSVHFTAPASGIYFVGIESWEHGESGAYELHILSGPDTYDYYDNSSYDAATLWESDGTILYFLGLDGNDTLIGAAFNETLLGGTGHDDLYGQNGNDALYGGQGADYLFGGVGADLLDGGSDIDTVFYDTSASGVSVDLSTGTAYGGDATGDTLRDIERIVGSSYNDLLVGDSNHNALHGQDGADTLVGNAGHDLLIGYDGDDILRGNAGNDVAFGLAGNDAIWAGAGDDDDDFSIGGSGNDTIGGGVGDDFLIGDGMNDGPTGHYTSQNDVSADGNDVLYGGDGNDTLLGGGWDDGAVNDNGEFDVGEAVTSGTRADQIWAGSGNDLVYGASGADALGGGTGDDTIYGGWGNDTLYGGPGSGADSLDGDEGHDLIYSGAGNDVVNGGGGNDNLFSGAGNDTVAGGAGDDTLWGGGGDDHFTGGDGRDLFVFEAGHGNDRITDFSAANDILNLAGTVTNFTSISSVQSVATAQGSDLLIDLGGGDSLLLVGIAVSDLASVTFVF